MSTESKRKRRPRMNHRIFRASLQSWQSLAAEAASFATDLGPENVVSISHSHESIDGIIIVWYWDN